MTGRETIYGSLMVTALFVPYFHVNIPDAPFEGFLVCMEERVEAVPPDSAAPVENFDGSSVAVASNNHFRAEGVSFVRVVCCARTLLCRLNIGRSTSGRGNSRLHAFARYAIRRPEPLVQVQP